MASTLAITDENRITAAHLAPRRVPGPALAGRLRNRSLLELQAWMPSEIGAITVLVDQLLALLQGWHCIDGSEFAVELALREALNNAVVHGNGSDPDKVVEVRCHCERGKGVWLTVKDEGKGFDPDNVPDPLAEESLKAEHGRGIQLMKVMMDEVSFACGGTEVRMRKGLARRATPVPRNNQTIQEKQHAHRLHG